MIVPACNYRSLCGLLIGFILLGGCGHIAPREEALFRDLGGRPGIERITDAFLFELADNRDVLPLFRNTNIQRFREQFSLQLCAISGGGCVYEGDSMIDTHRGMNISRAQFNSVVTDLVDAMDKTAVPVSAQNALLQRLAPLYGDIAGH